MLNFKKTAIAAVICTTALVSTAASAVTYDVLGGSFVMPLVSPPDGNDGFVVTDILGVGSSWSEGAAAFDGSAFGQTATCLGCGTIDPSAGLSGLGALPFFGGNVTTYFAPTGVDGITHAGPTVDVANGTADMGSFYANWNGTEFNQGSTGAVVADNGDGTLTLSWDSLIVGGAFGGKTGFWTMDIEAQAVPIPAAVWLFGSGLVGLVGIARRRKTS
ncbi:hypothetical protein MNBD_GAMMA12-2237 [hydrothermal vent metagenome]|uniref:PEP-CTERM protein-sorting domain-containing protein n=1 Tax=hydrothermal vent metagenome TaxID=652676 RepID=A0A3B0YQP6_9ZZZZ